MGVKRRIGSGIYRVVRFNWHFYVLAAIALATLIIFINQRTGWVYLAGWWIVVIGFLAVVLSLLVTFYVYDLSGLYRLSWLDQDITDKPGLMVNIHAGYDETSQLLAEKYPDAKLRVYDFYNAEKHTELSIRRARKLYPAFRGTQAITSDKIPLPSEAVDFVLLIFAAHEIRNDAERVIFFSECRRVLKPEGKIIVVEHLRDFPNAIAYHLGVFHFHAERTWRNTFKGAGLLMLASRKINPFVNQFIIGRDEHTLSNNR